MIFLFKVFLSPTYTNDVISLKPRQCIMFFARHLEHQITVVANSGVLLDLNLPSYQISFLPNLLQAKATHCLDYSTSYSFQGSRSGHRIKLYIVYMYIKKEWQIPQIQVKDFVDIVATTI